MWTGKADDYDCDRAITQKVKDEFFILNFRKQTFKNCVGPSG